MNIVSNLLGEHGGLQGKVTPKDLIAAVTGEFSPREVGSVGWQDWQGRQDWHGEIIDKVPARRLPQT
jgi:hypothetical protein